MRDELRNSYTDAPRLQTNLLIGSLRLLFWLFVHPSAWRNHIIRLDGTLSPDFSLADLHRRQWRNLSIWRLLVMTYLAWPLLVGGVLALGLWGFNFPTDTILLGVILGVAVGLIACFAVSIAGSLAIGVTVGIATGLIVGFGGSLLFNTPGALAISDNTYSSDIVVSALIGLTGGLAGGLAYGVAIGISAPRVGEDVTYSLIRRISGLVVGVLIGIGAGQLATFVTGNVASGLAVGIPFGLAVGWRTDDWRRGVLAALLLGLPASLSGGLSNAGFAGGVVQALALVAFIAALFTLPYILAKKLAGAWAGGLAGALGCGGGLFLFATSREAFGPFLAFSLIGILSGLTLAWWRPVLMYPFLAIWNGILWRLDERRLTQGRLRPLLRWHSAFWDEFQKLPLLNLDAYLLLILRTHLAEGRTAMAYLSATRQRWAAQATQIELDARELEQCLGASAIAAVHPGLAAGDLIGPASALLRSFSRISSDVAAALEQESAYNQRLALNAVEDRLDGLLRELTRTDEPYADRFRPIAAEWRRTVAEHSQVLAEVAELRQEIDSPYIIGVPLTEKQEIFIGRTDVTARIEQLLLDRRQPPLLLYGQRRVGKTSLLNNLGRLLPSTIVPMFVDLQGPASRAQSEAGFLYNVGRGMSRSAQQQRNVTLPSLTRDLLAIDPFTQFEEWLDEVALSLNGRIALLMLDEFEALEQVLAKERFDETIVLGMLRHLIQHRPQFKVLLSGSHTLDEFQRWSSYLINVQVIHIGYLRESEARQLITSPVQNFALQYEPAAVQRVLDLTHGHPFLIQLVCAEVVALKNEQPPTQRRLATVTDVETAVPQALAHGSFFFADIKQNQVDEAGASLLQFIAGQGEGAIVAKEALCEVVGGETAVLGHTLNALQQRALVEPVNGDYRFQIELIRRWFADHK